MNDNQTEQSPEQQVSAEFMQKLEKTSEERAKNSLYAMVASQVPEFTKKD